MRPVTRNVVIVILVVIVALLALGAVPSYLRSGAPYYVVAEPVESGPSVNASNLSERRYPYLTGAVSAAANGTDAGRSEPYWEGPFGVKESFAHSPFDEFDAVGQRYPDAAADGTVFVSRNGTRYRAEIIREGDT
ncbi:MAG: hypothetical protein V5A40_17065 [Haloarculaceae archaeon]